MAPLQQYTDAHRFIAQKFLFCGPAYRKDVVRLIEEAHKATGIELKTDDASIAGLFLTINSKTAKLNYKISTVQNEFTATRCYILSSISTRDIIDWKTDYTEKELEFISRMLMEFATSDTRELTRGDFYRLASSLKITNADCDRIINELKELSYLTTENPNQSDVETFDLGMRSTAELYDYMVERYSENLPECGTCKRKILTRGETVECGQCDTDTFFHIGCKKRALAPKAQGASQGIACSTCKSDISP